MLLWGTVFALAFQNCACKAKENRGFWRIFFSCWYNTLKAYRVCRWAFAVGGINTYHSFGASSALCAGVVLYCIKHWPCQTVLICGILLCALQWNNYCNVKRGSTTLVSCSCKGLYNQPFILYFRLVISSLVPFSPKMTFQCVDVCASFPGIKKISHSCSSDQSHV